MKKALADEHAPYIKKYLDFYHPPDLITVPERAALIIIIATVGRFSQRTHARPQGWIPVCAVTFFAVWRQVRRQLWRWAPPTPELSSRFWAVPDPYYTIPGRNRAARHFFIINQADAFVSHRYFQNGQNRPKTRYKPKIWLCEQFNLVQAFQSFAGAVRH